MSGSASAPTTCTFILRLRLEWAGEGLTWRGWIEHLPSGTRAAVQDWAAVAAFMRGFGVDGEEGNEGRKTEDEAPNAPSSGYGR